MQRLLGGAARDRWGGMNASRQIHHVDGAMLFTKMTGHGSLQVLDPVESEQTAGLGYLKGFAGLFENRAKCADHSRVLGLLFLALAQVLAEFSIGFGIGRPRSGARQCEKADASIL